MLMWILTSSGIAAFSALTLELLRETGDTGAREERGTFTWETMTDSEVQELLQEFQIEEDQPRNREAKLAA